MFFSVLSRLLNDPVSADLLLGSVFATLAVGFGIIWEHGPPDVRAIANKLVIGGILLETFCTVALFAYDANVIGVQNDKIIALETRLAPRKIENPAAMIEKLKLFSGVPFDIAIQPDSEPLTMLDQLTDVLKKAGWIWQPAQATMQFNAPGDPAMAFIVMRGGVAIRISLGRRKEWEPATKALAEALINEKLSVFAQANDQQSSSAIHISIGTKE